MDELRKGFHHDLGNARDQLALLAARVVELVPRATSVLLDGDLELAEYLISGDAEIDQQCVDVEEQCIQLLALQAPVATDLRQVVALLKMIAEIERSADLAANICKAARRIYGHDLDPKLRGIIARMGEQAASLFAHAIEAFRENDAAKAAALDDMDAYLDALQKQFIAGIFESQAGGRIDLQVAVQLAMVARFYERIGDHAVNMGQRVTYIVTGKVPDHSKPKRAKVEIDQFGSPSASAGEAEAT
jgi:phosphate transport system protein